MAQDCIHDGCRLIAADDGSMRNPRWNANPGTVFLLQSDQLELSILKNNQIQAAAQNHQLIGLVSMAEQFCMWC